MATGHEHDASHDAGRGEPIPHSWMGVISGLSLTAFALLVCGASLGAYLDERPVDLSPMSQHMARVVEDAFSDAGISPMSVERIDRETRRDDAARWAYAAWAVRLPDTHSVTGVTKVLERQVAPHGLTVTEDVDERRHALMLKLGERVVGAVMLVAEDARVDAANVLSAADFLPRMEPVDKTALTRISLEPPSAKRSDSDPKELPKKAEVARATGQPVPGRAPVANAPLPNPDRNDQLDLEPEPASEAPSNRDIERELEIPINLEPGPEPEIPVDLDAEPDSDEWELEDDVLAELLELDEESLIARSGARTRVARTRAVTQPKVAIIVDDGGYGGAATEQILALPRKLTLSILPNAPFTVETGRRAAALGFEVMLHMPMESDNPDVLYPGRLTTDMTAREIHRLTASALAQVPFAVGVNNHTGSKFTSQADVLRPFLQHLREQGLFFVDSYTSRASVAGRLAEDMGLDTATRSVFLDNEQDAGYIESMFEELMAEAKERGSAIGICHFRPVTARVLAYLLTRLRAEGIALVPVSELVR